MIEIKSPLSDETILKEITKIKDKIGHFPTQKELRILSENVLANLISKHGGFNKFRLLSGCELLRKPDGYWNDDTIIQDLSNIKKELGHFPTTSELISLNRLDLSHAIQRHGGINKFRKLFGYNLLRENNGYWTNEVIIEKLLNIKNDIGYFPTQKELISLGHGDLVNEIFKHGGINKFRKIFNDGTIRVSNGFWTDNVIIENIVAIKHKIGHFPTQRELIDLERNDLATAITRNGGFNKFRELLNEKIIQKPRGFWSDDVIIKDLTKIKSDIGHFPSRQEFIKLGRTDLMAQITIHGGTNKFRQLLNDEIIKVSNGYWTEEITINELLMIKEKIGHFPSHIELKSLNRTDLLYAVSKYGGINSLRRLLGYEPIHKEDGYWDDEKMVQDLTRIRNKVGHFPTREEIENLGLPGLLFAIKSNGNINKFRELLGESPSLFQKYREEMASYVNKRGKGSENLVKFISQDYCHQNGFPEPKYNIKLTKSHVLEIICDVGKTIGIDVTNTNNKSIVSQKWRKKSYHLHLDELWIVVFSDSFTPDDYFKWNQKSPENVKVFSIYGFLKELDYSLDSQTKSKIDKYCSCTFHTKEEFEKIKKFYIDNIK